MIVATALAALLSSRGAEGFSLRSDSRCQPSPAGFQLRSDSRLFQPAPAHHLRPSPRGSSTARAQQRDLANDAGGGGTPVAEPPPGPSTLGAIFGIATSGSPWDYMLQLKRAGFDGVTRVGLGSLFGGDYMFLLSASAVKDVTLDQARREDGASRVVVFGRSVETCSPSLC